MEIENKKIKKQRGFALLTAIIITGMLLLVSFVVADLAYKELILTSTGQQSQIAFYMADSGAECALYWDLKNGPTSAFDVNTPGSVTCNNQTVTTGSQTVQTIPTQQSQVGGGGGGGTLTNYALSGTANSSGDYSGGYPASSVINGDRRGVGWGSGNGGWNDSSNNDWSNDWISVAFPSAKSISEIDVYTLADGYPLASDPGPSDTFTQYGITAFEVQYSTNNGGSYADIPGGNVTGNNLIWRKFTFSAISGVTNIRVLVHNSLFGYSRIVELEAWGGGGGGPAVPSIFQINFANSCAIVQVTKNGDGTTKIDSRGYNTCDTSVARRFERGITITY